MTSCVVSVTGDLLHDVLRVDAEEGSCTPLVIPDPLLKLGKVRASDVTSNHIGLWSIKKMQAGRGHTACVTGIKRGATRGAHPSSDGSRPPRTRRRVGHHPCA